jgi:uncharacterized protein DUF6438
MLGLRLALVAALAGCATTGAGSPEDGPATISYETGPCFGACPIYRVTVNADGSGVFEGRRWTRAEGNRSFRVTAQQYQRLVAHLEPLRPASGSIRYSGEACESMATDLPSAEVTWEGPAGAQQLYFYHGCDMEKNRPIAERLNAVPDLLPIGEFINAGD